MTKAPANSTVLNFIGEKLSQTSAFATELRRDFVVTESTVMGVGPSTVSVTTSVLNAEAIRALAARHGLSEGTSWRKRSPMSVDDETSTDEDAQEGGQEGGMGKGDRKKTKEKKHPQAAKPAAAVKAPKAAKTPTDTQAYKAYPRCPKKGCRGWYKQMEDHFRKNPTHRVDETTQEPIKAAEPAAQAS